MDCAFMASRAFGMACDNSDLDVSFPMSSHAQATTFLQTLPIWLKATSEAEGGWPLWSAHPLRSGGGAGQLLVLEMAVQEAGQAVHQLRIDVTCRVDEGFAGATMVQTMYAAPSPVMAAARSITLLLKRILQCNGLNENHGLPRCEPDGL